MDLERQVDVDSLGVCGLPLVIVWAGEQMKPFEQPKQMFKLRTDCSSKLAGGWAYPRPPGGPPPAPPRHRPSTPSMGRGIVTLCGLLRTD